MHALLELDCMPSGMELFPASNDTQWDLIRRVIDDSDYYILIVGGRYGSTGPQGLSFTEMEYRYALSKEKPTIAFIHRNPGRIVAENTETSEEGRTKLLEFRALIEKKLCKHWETPQELGSVVSRSLIQLMKSNPAIGWVRADELPDRDATLELLHMRRRVEELESALHRARISPPLEASGLASGNEGHNLLYKFRACEQYGRDAQTWRGSVSLTWDDIFSSVAPLMIHEATDALIREALNYKIEELEIERLRKNKELQIRSLDRFEIKEDNFQTVKVQLRALGLICKNQKQRSVKDQETYWTLTPYGDSVMTRLRAIRKDVEDVALDEGVCEDDE